MNSETIPFGKYGGRTSGRQEYTGLGHGKPDQEGGTTTISATNYKRKKSQTGSKGRPSPTKSPDGRDETPDGHAP